MNDDNISNRTRARNRGESPRSRLRDASPTNASATRQRSQSPPKKKQRIAKSGGKKPKKEAPKLIAPLSELTKDMVNVPIKNMAAWVRRSIDERLLEVEKQKGKVNRPMNSFMLYRSAFADRTKVWCTDQNHQTVSTVCGVSWKMESQSLKNYYGELAKIERVNHQKAHPDYKFQPAKPKGKGKQDILDEESELGEVFDNEDPDGEWAPTQRGRARKRNLEDDGRLDSGGYGMRSVSPGLGTLGYPREHEYQHLQEYEAAASSFHKAPRWDMRDVTNLVQLPSHMQEHVAAARELYPANGSFQTIGHEVGMQSHHSQHQSQQHFMQHYQYPQQYLRYTSQPIDAQGYSSRVNTPVPTATAHSYHHLQSHPNQYLAPTSGNSGFVGLPSSASHQDLISMASHGDSSLHANGINASIDPSIMDGNNVYVREVNALPYPEVYDSSNYTSNNMMSHETIGPSTRFADQADSQTQNRISSPLHYHRTPWKPDTNDDGDALGVNLGIGSGQVFDSLWLPRSTSISHQMVDEVDTEVEAPSEKDEDTVRTTGVSGIVATQSVSFDGQSRPKFDSPGESKSGRDWLSIEESKKQVEEDFHYPPEADQRRMVEFLGDDNERFVERPGFTDDLDVMKSPKTR
jgi:hypothetical protein